jgi:hypothetical protein
MVEVAEERENKHKCQQTIKPNTRATERERTKATAKQTTAQNKVCLGEQMGCVCDLCASETFFVFHVVCHKQNTSCVSQQSMLCVCVCVGCVLSASSSLTTMWLLFVEQKAWL